MARLGKKIRRRSGAFASVGQPTDARGAPLRLARGASSRTELGGRKAQRKPRKPPRGQQTAKRLSGARLPANHDAREQARFGGARCEALCSMQARRDTTGRLASLPAKEPACRRLHRQACGIPDGIRTRVTRMKIWGPRPDWTTGTQSAARMIGTTLVEARTGSRTAAPRSFCAACKNQFAAQQTALFRRTGPRLRFLASSHFVAGRERVQRARRASFVSESV